MIASTPSFCPSLGREAAPDLSAVYATFLARRCRRRPGRGQAATASTTGVVRDGFCVGANVATRSRLSVADDDQQFSRALAGRRRHAGLI
jgi:hypothetical protein